MKYPEKKSVRFREKSQMKFPRNEGTTIYLGGSQESKWLRDGDWLGEVVKSFKSDWRGEGGGCHYLSVSIAANNNRNLIHFV